MNKKTKVDEIKPINADVYVLSDFHWSDDSTVYFLYLIDSGISKAYHLSALQFYTIKGSGVPAYHRHTSPEKTEIIKL